MLQHKYFTHDGFSEKFIAELRQKVQKEYEDNPLLKTLGITIHGSLHDYLHQPVHKEANDKLLHREMSTIQAQMSTRDHPTASSELATGLVIGRVNILGALGANTLLYVTQHEEKRLMCT